ncbi:hypothetical protein ACMD2_09617 [Ananas comosus]|uniref:TOD1/MUCI70 glycosyltransferase-like domain-containing protein n=1 Tax=Ananas comosus TaxID=4615 RepID=A0A199VLR7_ANACO|nr:hypothetical protein ACMD2_09617 [Ananas comosus]
MTGGSLGLRSGSYGSLQQQQLLQLHNGAILSVPSPPLSGRKPSKMLLSGSREKERLLQRICKIVGRRKVGMLLLLIVSATLYCSLFSVVSKDEDESSRLENTLEFSNHVGIIMKPGNTETRGSIKQQFTAISNQIQPHIPTLPPVALFTHHPCENFSFSLPPLDKKRTGPRPCPVCYVSVEEALMLMPPLPSESIVIKNLSYVSEETLVMNESIGGSLFGGYPSLEQRNEYFDIKESMTIHCGFVRGKKPSQGSGFDLDYADLLEMEQCRGILVASAIFGNYDIMQQPKHISQYSKENVCFYMFVDEETYGYIRNSSTIDSRKRVGLWRVLVVRNLPYTDARRNGKIPKLLLHRLFPNVRWSLWIDGKLELVVDPLSILERFLWRKKVTFAISRHYKRFDVFEEAEANKAAGKYDNVSIDYQIGFYKREGLTHYTPAKLPITSDVPEGCVIIREHTPITNLFTCLWFNEVDRFTSRDQLSFSTVRDKIMSQVNWTADMFLDCERRNFVVQSYHRDLLEQRLAALPPPPPPFVTREAPRKLFPGTTVNGAVTRTSASRKVPVRRGRDRKSGSRRHRSKATPARENNSV